MAISVKEAINLIQERTKVVNYELIPIENSLGRICAQELFATHFLPRFNNSAMDGYAVNTKDAGKEVKVIDTIFAGSKIEPEIDEGSCVKIMTGARVPDSANAIVPIENVEITSDKKIKLPNDIKPNAHIRFIGEDIKNGELILETGEEINFAKITLLASQGITHIQAYKKPKIAIFASGEELKLHHEDVEDYQIYNSNTPTLLSRAEELGCDVSFAGSANDSIESIKEHILNALDADLIVTSGGISVGDADFTKEAFDELGFETIFNGIIIKPGKPTVFGKIKDTFILNLPGNPLASSLIFEIFGKILLQVLSGNKQIHHNYIETIISEDLSNKKGRITIIPGFFDGSSFTPSIKRSPGMVSVLSKCNSLIALDDSVETLNKDDKVKILPIDWKFFTKEEKDFLTS